MSERLPIPDQTRQYQARASDPSASAWVSANAGSGKTHVLTQRVLRLLLAGVPPSQILCLTYTKAAAANMAGRVFKALADWTRLSDAALAQAIVATGAPRPEAPQLAAARRLFARTIETPGGLKIQTIHAFCERLLHLFPFEANVAAHFRVADEREETALMAQARGEALAELLADPAGAEALAIVAREAGAFGFDAVLKEALGEREAFAAYDNAADYAAALATALGLATNASLDSVEADILGGARERSQRAAWAQSLAQGSTNDQKLAASLRAVDAPAERANAVDALFKVFFTAEGEPRGGRDRAITTKPTAKRAPELVVELLAEQDRLIALRERRRAARTFERSRALQAVAGAILARYAGLKGERGLLDFSDQIARVLALMTRAEAAWVLHKLDYGLDHLLVDEAQDTSSEQWRILAALTEEFFAGAGARPLKRTVFAVGDEKQSIFSFQGAAPEKFAAMRRAFERRHSAAGLAFAEVPLTLSFRSSPQVLAVVDRTFAQDLAWRGVAADGEPPMPHAAYRAAQAGMVELWPLVSAADDDRREDWLMPLDALNRDDPPVILARRIAAVVKGWLAQDTRERIVDPRSGEVRRIRPGDVMILVRKRGAFFEAMIRALKSQGIAAAGADRLMLREHIAVMDLMAAGRAALRIEDDLSLAAVLKSPLGGLDDDDLLKVAPRRPGSLADALEASPEAKAVAASRRLALWRERAGALTPHAFYARLLGEDGGRRALLTRLGPDAADPIDEFLALALGHEQSQAPSLANFLAEIEATETAIKRDMEAEGEGVRVLTVHASKGLEAPIVFLPDTAGAPNGRHDPKLMRLDDGERDEPALVVWAGKADEDCETLEIARAAARAAEAGEHRRVLYVAMTRAAQRLIVAGYKGRGDCPPDCWHSLVSGGLAELASEAPAPYGEGESIRRFGAAPPCEDEPVSPGSAAIGAAPDWLARPAPREQASAPLSPSRAAASREANAAALEAGRFAHALLQSLPQLAPDERAAAAERMVQARAAALEADAARQIARDALAVIAAPQLAALFGPRSRGEVAVAGAFARPGQPPLPIRGRVDRLAETDEGLQIADFKLGAAPAEPPEAYVAQLALYAAALAPLYPGRKLTALLVYLAGPTVAPIPAKSLSAALELVCGEPRADATIRPSRTP